MSIARRALMTTTGAGLLLAGAGGLFAATRRPAAALRAWDEALASTTDARLDVLRHAILAPSPHNRQPWRIGLVGADEVVLTCDLDRRLPHTDPFDRQITIGFGCFLELASIAAAERGLRLETTLFPEGEPQPRLDARPIARLRFVADRGVARDKLFAWIGKRRSSKVPFDPARPVEAATLASLGRPLGDGAAVTASADPALVGDLRALTWRAWMIEATVPRTWRESVDLMRIGRAEIEANPDGIALGGPLLEALALVGQLSRSALADPGSVAFKSGIDKYRPIMEQTPAYLWVTTAGNSRAEQIAAGRAHVRANLAATAAELCLHPVSQALQEFPEMAGEFEAVHQRLDVASPGRVQMLARIGYGPAVEPAVRWPLADKLKAV